MSVARCPECHGRGHKMDCSIGRRERSMSTRVERISRELGGVYVDPAHAEERARNLATALMGDPDPRMWIDVRQMLTLRPLAVALDSAALDALALRVLRAWLHDRTGLDLVAALTRYGAPARWAAIAPGLDR
jgi:hypothetical protein